MARRAVWLGGLALVLAAALAAAYVHATRHAATATLRIGAGPKGTDLFDLIEAVARVAETKNELIRVEVVATAGADENLDLLARNELDLAAVPSDTLAEPGLTLVTTLFPDAYHLIVSAANGVARIEDLPGKRIAIPPIGTSENRAFWYLVGQYSIPSESIRTTPLEAGDAMKALRRDEVDGVFLLRAPGDRRIRWLADAKSIRIVPVDQAAAMLDRRSVLTAATLHKGSYSGKPAVPGTDVPTVASDRLLLARAGVAPEPIRALTAVLFDHKRDLNALSRLASYIRQPDLGGGTLLPVHPGAIAYFDRDQPSLFQRNADLIGIGLSLAALLGSGLIWLKNRLFARRKNTADVYNLDLIAIADEARASTSRKALAVHRDKLDRMLADVVRDLDEDRIDGDGFNYFAFTWEAVRKTIEDRRNTLKR